MRARGLSDAVGPVMAAMDRKVPGAISRVLFCVFGNCTERNRLRDTKSRNPSNSGCDEVFGGRESGEYH